jgi:hypothetical protein
MCTFKNVRASSTGKYLWHMGMHQYSRFYKYVFLGFQKTEIKCAYTYKHTKGTVEILDEYMFYFNLHKKTNV